VRPATKKYAAITGTLAATGYTYSYTKGGAPISTGSSGLDAITFSGPALGAPFDGELTLNSKNALVVGGSPHMTFTLNPQNGVYAGAFKPAGASVALPFYGVLMQPLETGTGLFLSGTTSGSVEIAPQ
jgi:hypothetical protein